MHLPFAPWHTAVCSGNLPNSHIRKACGGGEVLLFASFSGLEKGSTFPGLVLLVDRREQFDPFSKQWEMGVKEPAWTAGLFLSFLWE